MCKPCQAELAKYRSGGTLKRKKGSSVNLYQDSGVLQPTRTSERTIDTDKFSASNVLDAFQNYGTAQGTMDAYKERYAGLEADLIAEQNRVANVRGNVLDVAKNMETVASNVSKPDWAIDQDSDSLARQQWQQMEAISDSDMTIEQQREAMKEINKNRSPDLNLLLPNRGTSPDNPIFTLQDYDRARGDEKPTRGYELDRSLMCIGGVCGAYQEAGGQNKIYVANTDFREKVLAGNTQFTEIPFSEAEIGDVIQNVDDSPIDYNDYDSGYVYRPHHAGIMSGRNKDGTVSAYNAVGGSIDYWGNQSQFGADEDHYAYRYTGNVPSMQKETSNFGREAAAFNFFNPKSLVPSESAQSTQSTYLPPSEKQLSDKTQVNMPRISKFNLLKK